MKLIWCWQPTVKADFPGKCRIPCDRVYLLRQEWLSIHAIHHHGTCYSQHFLEPPVLLTLAVLPKAGYPQLRQDGASMCNSKEDTRMPGGFVPCNSFAVPPANQESLQGQCQSHRGPWRCETTPGCVSRHPVTSFLRESGISGPGHLSVKLQEWQCPLCSLKRALNTHSLSNMPW